MCSRTFVVDAAAVAEPDAVLMTDNVPMSRTGELSQSSFDHESDLVSFQLRNKSPLLAGRQRTVVWTMVLNYYDRQRTGDLPPNDG